MKYRGLTDTGDYKFGNNEYDFLTDVDAIAQAIKTKVLLFYGEWWENIGIGIPMFQSIIGQSNIENVKNAASLLIEKRIKEIPQVTSVDSIVINTIGRSISFVINITTSSGTSEVEVNI